MVIVRCFEKSSLPYLRNTRNTRGEVTWIFVVKTESSRVGVQELRILVVGLHIEASAEEGYCVAHTERWILF